MTRLAFHQLFTDPVRSALTALALAAVIGVSLVLQGFEQGLYHQLQRTALARGADLILTQAGVSNLLAARSTLPQLARQAVEAVPGVANAHPFTGFPQIYAGGGRRTPVFVMVFDTLGGPARLVEGRPIASGQDVVVDESLARKYDLRVGDPFLLSDYGFRIAGISRGDAALFTPFVFINYDGLIDLFLESEIAPDISTFPLLSFLLVELSEGADTGTVARAIEAQVPAVDVFTPEALAGNDINLGRTLFGPVMRLLLAVSYVIGVLVVGLIVYADINARRRNFGVLLALGFDHRRIGTTVLAQAGLLLLLAFPLGVLLAETIAQVVHGLVPLYLVEISTPGVLGKALAGVVAMAAAGALLPLRLLRRVDPQLVFSGSG